MIALVGWLVGCLFICLLGIEFRTSDIRWASRWDVYLSMNRAVPDKVRDRYDSYLKQCLTVCLILSHCLTYVCLFIFLYALLGSLV